MQFSSYQLSTHENWSIGKDTYNLYAIIWRDYNPTTHFVTTFFWGGRWHYYDDISTPIVSRGRTTPLRGPIHSNTTYNRTHMFFFCKK